MTAAMDREGTKLNAESSKPRILIVGAGSRGNSYARFVVETGLGEVAAVAEPIAHKRQHLGSRYIWSGAQIIPPGTSFENWQDFLDWERQRRQDAEAGRTVPKPINAVFVCVLDEQHAQVVTAFAPFGFHIMCEKPLATSLADCLSIYSSLHTPGQEPDNIFGIGHVLRYSPLNMKLRDLVLEQEVIGDVLSVERTEPVGWWHFSHSYVRSVASHYCIIQNTHDLRRGNWRRESKTAPSLLSKSCHDIDWLLWMLCSPSRKSDSPPHLPSLVSSSGSLNHFKRSRKPRAAGNATNCLSCPIEQTCMYSARKIYYERKLAKGIVKWPVDIVVPDIEACLVKSGSEAAKEKLMHVLEQDYDDSLSDSEKNKRPWFGRCVWESDNDVCDDQYVTITWDEDRSRGHGEGHGAKTATFHMVAQSQAQCERRGRIYGTHGEIDYDEDSITVYDFATETKTQYHPPRRGGGHGGGDSGLVEQFLKAVIAVDYQGVEAEQAQKEHLGCTLEEIIRSHALVFAAEEARTTRTVVDWKDWWHENVDAVVVT